MSEVREKIIDAFIDRVSLHGEVPKSVYAFCKSEEFSEESFYQSFSNFESLEKSIWNDLFQEVVKTIEGDPVYGEYNTKERYLAYCFTLIEQMKKHLSFYKISVDRIDLLHALDNPVLKGIKSQAAFVDGLIRFGTDQGEIKTPVLMVKPLSKLFQSHTAFVIKYFIKDDSAGFSQTDQAIEKSVRLLFDAIENSLIESVLDFSKFMGKAVFS